MPNVLIRPTISMSIGAIALFVVACSKPKDESSNIKPATTANPVASTETSPLPVEDFSRCTTFIQNLCKSGASASAQYAFTGDYADSKCKKPIAHADVMACSLVPKNESARVMIAAPLTGHQESEMPVLKIGRQVAPTEPLFHMSDDGPCEATTMKGLKLAPVGCTRVCRGSSGLECCPQTQCPNFEGSRVLVLFDP